MLSCVGIQMIGAAVDFGDWCVPAFDDIICPYARHSMERAASTLWGSVEPELRCSRTNSLRLERKDRYSRASLASRRRSAELNNAFRTTRQIARGRK